jgi:hypothetical protein
MNNVSSWNYLKQCLEEQRMKPHKHALLIKAWADGYEIQQWLDYLQVWDDDENPKWDRHTEYRIKPLEKVRYLILNYPSTNKWFETDVPFKHDCIKIVRDMNGKLISAKVHNE